MIDRRAGISRRTDWDDPHLRETAAFMRDYGGLMFTGSRIASAEDAMRRVMSRFGLRSTAELRRRAQAGEDVREALFDELTVGESYFFREPRQLEMVRRAMIARAAAHPNSRIRVWSAGCASGEEPYTLAIMLREDRPAATAQIIGSDVAVARLAAARRARYSRWALRGLSEEWIAQYFEPLGKQFVLDDNIRRMVQFQALNLASGDYPSDARGIGDFDVILCRNVLIYMALPTVAKIAERLLASLAPDGWLFLGASDPPLGSLVRCEVVATPVGMAYRRADHDGRRTNEPFAIAGAASTPTADPQLFAAPLHAEAPPSAPPPAAPVSPLPAETPQPEQVPVAIQSGELATPAERDNGKDAYRMGDYERAAELAREAIRYRNATGAAADPSTDREDELDSVRLVRALSNLGRIGEAAEACAAALERHRDSSELAYLHSILLLHAGHHEAAAAAARRALYLDRSFVLAHLALGTAFARAGNRGRARRAFLNAVDLLESAPSDAEVPGGEGARAARFLRIGLDQLDALEHGRQ